MSFERQTILIEFSYDGALFCGLQPQPDYPTVGGSLLVALNRAMGCEARGVAFAARTDKYVSAQQNFATCWFREIEEIDKRLSDFCALRVPGLRIIGAMQVDRSLNARNSPTAKRYQYRIRDGVTPELATPPFGPSSSAASYNAASLQTVSSGASPRAWCVVPRLHVEPMQEASWALVGTHDFSAFRAGSCDGKNPTKTMRYLQIVRHQDCVILTLEANAFLRKMVRIVAGTLAEVGAGLRSPTSLTELLESHSRQAAGVTAPGHGLTLQQVFF